MSGKPLQPQHAPRQLLEVNKPRFISPNAVPVGEGGSVHPILGVSVEEHIRER